MHALLCCYAATTVRMVSAVLALEVEEDLEEVEGCSQQRMADCLAEAAGSSVMY